MLNEADIIAQFKSSFPHYIGDDAAVIEKNSAENYVITKDILVEDIHFRLKYGDPISLAHKALQVNLSDLAAMGAQPQFILLAVALPSGQENYSQAFLQAFSAACKKMDVVLIGGDTTRSPDKFFISVTAIGIAKTEQIKYRHTAQLDDVICTAGASGYAHLGLLACEKNLENLDQFKQDFLQPNAKIAEGIWLAEQTAVHAMMDISDGLYIDLKKLCHSSNCKAVINLNDLLFLPEFLRTCQTLSLDPIEIILSGGEDYSLLFTVKMAEYENLALAFSNKFDYSLNTIGKITVGIGIEFIKHGHIEPLNLSPFTHFGESI